MKLEIKNKIASETAKSIYAAYPTLWERFGVRGFEHTEKDNHHHLDHLETAYSLNDAKVFVDYAIWLETVLTSRNVETALIIDNFERLQKVLPGNIGKDEEAFMLRCLTSAIAVLSPS
ncbi:hypothetical protein QOZ98_001791 [Planomicrobium stackebrandtii]|uniref:Uncharacterized protein n=1 Tax=Planomicrobium stackebrandtii TaxID=253160 RepID=A0ABU0GVL6_9BACL|nr:hypothetical protein [Planomicrobium stackebrandtii]MDQ0428964.1 hypothetical protein [Planomicrobium stackebrandtii]